MDVPTFCTALKRELGTQSGRDEARVRAGLELCDLYGNAEAARFEAILVQLSSRPTSSAVSEGATWLLSRWRATLPRNH
jgi:hypothetical protein